MQEQNRVANCAHLFEAVTRNGVFGEISVRTPLTAAQVDILKNDPAEAKRVCPHGAIQCAKCAAPLLQATIAEVTKPRGVSTAAMLRSLKRPGNV